MPDTIGGALRAVIVADGVLNGRVFRGRAPDGATFPYSTFLEPISDVPTLSGDARVDARRMQVQVDLWQKLREEDPAVLSRLAACVDGAQLILDSGRKAWRTRLTQVTVVDDPDALIVHHALTVTINHRGL